VRTASIIMPMSELGELWWNDIDAGKLLIRSPELSGNPTSKVIW
jgi:hypothetical protein